MGIERLGSVDPLAAYNRSQNVSRSAKNVGDSISVSDEAKAKSEIFKLNEHVRNSDDVRLDKVEDAKRKLADPNYINATLYGNVADKIMESLGI